MPNNSSPQNTPPPEHGDRGVNKSAYWGVWETLGWGLLIMLCNFIGQIVGWKMAASDGLQVTTLTAEIVVASAWGGVLLSVPLIAVLTQIKSGNMWRYLGFDAVTVLQLIKYIALMVLVIVAFGALNELLERPPSEFMKQLFSSLNSPWALVIAVMVAAPLFEELFFRGFLFESLLAHGVNPVAVITMTSLVWTAIHIQYGSFELLFLFVFGLLLGYAKYKTNSLWLVLIMHAMANGLASMEMLMQN